MLEWFWSAVPCLEISKLQNYKITRMYVHVFCWDLSGDGCC